jgi:hypothetical protein
MANNISSLYVIEVRDASSVLLADLTGIAQLRNLEVERNHAGYVEFEIDIHALEVYCRDNLLLTPDELFNVNINEIRVKRGSRYLFSGQINYAAGELNEEGGIYTVRAVGWLKLFEKRFTAAERVFTGVDAGEIAMTLIDETQALSNGDFGIDTNASYIQTSQNRDRTYSYDEVAKELVYLSEVINGFDFEFTYDKKFMVYYPKMGIDRTAEVLFEYPKNIKTIRWERNGEEMVNQALMIGNGVFSTRTNTDYTSVYKLRQEKEERSDIIETVTLEEHGDEILRVKKTYQNLIDTIEIDGKQSPAIGSYWLGDLVKIRVNGMASFDLINEVTYRIDLIGVSIDENLTETISLKLSLP